VETLNQYTCLYTLLVLVIRSTGIPIFSNIAVRASSHHYLLSLIISISSYKIAVGWSVIFQTITIFFTTREAAW